MAAILLLAVATIVLALFLGLLVPGAGLALGGVVIVLGIGAIVWLAMAGGARQMPSDLASETQDVELLGPGGPDDPRS
jgi:hypothetical protein